MELTPQQLFDVEFSEQWRGYNRDEVDDFIERVAAGVAALQERLRSVTERAARAEQRTQNGDQSGGGARRTLVLAQRTADATVAEARQTAAGIVGQAQEEARAILLKATEAAPTEHPEPGTRVDVVELQVTKSRLEADVAALERHVTDRRGRIQDLLGELQRRLDDGLGHGVEDPLPAPSDEDPLAPSEAPEPALHADLEWAGDDQEWELAQRPPVMETSAYDIQQDLAAPEPPPPMPEPVLTDAESPPPAPEPGPEEWVPAEAGGADDNFFAQLRGALDDDAPLGPRDDYPFAEPVWGGAAPTVDRGRPTLYDQERTERRKFGLRLRRQRRHA